MYDILKDILVKKGISLEDFATSMGITLNTLRRNLSNNPRLSTIEEVAGKLNVHITELFQQPTKDADIPNVHGFLKVDNSIHEIKSIEDLKDLYTTL